MIRRVNFIWKSMDCESKFDLVTEINILFEHDNTYPRVIIKNKNIFIEDNSLDIDINDILRQISKIDFESKYDKYCPTSYSGDKWYLTIDDKEYKGTMEDPHYITKIKKIIRYEAIKNMAFRKIAAYLKA